MEVVDLVEEAGQKISIGGMGGFFYKGMRWKDYIETRDEEEKEYAEAMRRFIVKYNYRFGGDDHQADSAPLFEDGTIGSFSFRAWGDIMAAIWSDEENKDYSYMDFYMTCLIK